MTTKPPREAVPNAVIAVEGCEYNRVISPLAHRIWIGYSTLRLSCHSGLLWPWCRSIAESLKETGLVRWEGCLTVLHHLCTEQTESDADLLISRGLKQNLIGITVSRSNRHSRPHTMTPVTRERV